MPTRDPASMKVTPAKRRLLLAMLGAEGKSEREQNWACFQADQNGVCYSSLQDYGMVCPPGVLTERGRELAIEIRDAELPEKRPAPMFD